jgi:deoxyribodipyrimidine photo-lyase
MTTIVWFRQDLRTADNPALAAAAARGPVLPLYILDEVNPGPKWSPGGASRWWLHHSLATLRDNLGGLVLQRGDPHELLSALVKASGANAVLWNRCYEPYAIARDTAIKSALQAQGVEVQSFNGSLLHEPWDVATGAGGPFKVYTPFWRACRGRPVAAPVRKPKLDIVTGGKSDRLDDWELLPSKPNWAKGFETIWQPGEAGARKRLDRFVKTGLADYRTQRDRPDKENISRLSPHLHFGEISPRQLWARMAIESEDQAKAASAEKFLAEIGWREFSHHLLYHFPTLPDANWRPAFDAYPWRDSEADLKAWQRGMTGYPLVDAGMRELWHTGFMHNRVRMVAASFLIKHLRIDWRRGEEWFWDTLLDADLANNAAGWQWVAGSGADASPYFRIFNPMMQGEKFDPDGAYVRRWCPELAKLPDDAIHAPFKAKPEVLAKAGVELGRTYPKPIVDHDEARAKALAGYKAVRAERDADA